MTEQTPIALTVLNGANAGRLRACPASRPRSAPCSAAGLAQAVMQAMSSSK